ncbi:diguanylate cyclase (GGDEF)-like protein [Desulfobaculum xiamenense]|uniref:diguanylate cyclase n=2 Tax=Desulfobaculum xiamenense TaxID=995050 RepID=A0A846QP54_9BACT|nr:diguanylate cyclase (GGDEF)-like protein [Desulfobaculum xiamenense]
MMRNLAAMGLHFVKIFVPLVMALSAVALMLYFKESQRTLESLIDMERNRIVTEKAIVERNLQMVVSDLLFLSGMYALTEDGLSPETHVDSTRLGEALARFARTRGVYGEIRFIDDAGRTIAGVWADRGGVRSIGASDGMERFVREDYLHARDLGRGELLVSRFDLGSARGEARVPLQPRLRLIAPVFARSGKPVGRVLIAFNGGRLFDELRVRHVNSPGQIMMLDEDGYWMLGPNPEQEWGFMREDGKSLTMAVENPEVWSRIGVDGTGQFRDAAGLYSFDTIDPVAVAGHEAQRMFRVETAGARGLPGRTVRWVLVSHVPESVLAGLLSAQNRSYLFGYGMLLLLVSAGAWIVARANGERTAAYAELARTNDDLNTVVERLERRNRATVRINTMVDFLQACRSENEIFSIVASNAASLLPGTSGMLNIHNDETGLLECVASWGEGFCGRSLFTRESCWALRRGQTHIVARPGEGPPCQHFQPEPTTGAICVPLIAHGKVTGLLSALFPPDTQTMDQERLQRYAVTAEQHLVVVAEHVALTLSNLRLRESLREQSIRDPLTGLYNRRHMEESLVREFSRSERHGHSLSVILLDVDHFKRFNDTYGHELGDEVLRRLGETLRTLSRAEDIACRFGGEEFMLILPGATAGNAERRAEEIRSAVENRMKIRHGDQKLNVTISLGVSEYPAHASSVDALIATSDAALYAAKEAGRNRVMLASPLDV